MASKKHPIFKIIPGERDRDFFLGTYRVRVSPRHRPPFPVDAMVWEEDTWLILSAQPVVSPPGEHIIRTMTEILETLPVDVGSVIVKRGRPYRLLAVVHDLSCKPSWQKEWVERALTGVFHEVAQRQWTSLALPLLGTRHGNLDPQYFLPLLVDTLKMASPSNLSSLWLIPPPGRIPLILDLLHQLPFS